MNPSGGSNTRVIKESEILYYYTEIFCIFYKQCNKNKNENENERLYIILDSKVTVINPLKN